MERYQFRADDSKRKDALKSLREHSTKHKVLTVLTICCIIWVVVCYGIMNQSFANMQFSGMGPMGESFGGSIKLLVTIMCVLLMSGVPLIVLVMYRKAMVDGQVMARKMEWIELDEHGMHQMYSFEHNDRRTRFMVTRKSYVFMGYRDIQRIEWYEQEQIAKVYGTVYFLRDPGVPRDGNVLRQISNPGKAYRVLFPYYDHIESLVHLLSERAGVPVDKLPKCVSSLQEIRNEGVD